MAEIDVVVYGGTNLSGAGAGCSCGCAHCGGVQNVEAEFKKMVEFLGIRYGESVSFKFINTDDGSISDYPEIEKVIMNGYAFPITEINNTPYLAGAVDPDAIMEIIAEIRGEGCSCDCGSCGGCN